jgi:hypothetical protein
MDCPSLGRSCRREMAVVRLIESMEEFGCGATIPEWNGARDGTRTRDLCRDRAAL